MILRLHLFHCRFFNNYISHYGCGHPCFCSLSGLHWPKPWAKALFYGHCTSLIFYFLHWLRVFCFRSVGYGMGWKMRQCLNDVNDGTSMEADVTAISQASFVHLFDAFLMCGWATVLFPLYKYINIWSGYTLYRAIAVWFIWNRTHSLDGVL